MKKLLILAALLFITPQLSNAATCYGADNCRACKNCNYCKNCNSGGKKCGVYNRIYGTPKKAKHPEHSKK